jgi:hypothetical protein
MAPSDEIQLDEVIEAIRTCRIDIVNRTKNQETRLLLGITVCEQEDMVRSLTQHDYHEGPLDDRDTIRGGKLWVFKTELMGHPIYVKVKVIEIEDGRRIVKAISCHIDYM